MITTSGAKSAEMQVREKYPKAFADDDEVEQVIIYDEPVRTRKRIFPGEEATAIWSQPGEKILGSGDCLLRAWASALKGMNESR